MALMGIGNIGRPDIVFKRNFRWTLEMNTPCGFIPIHYMKSAARPSIETDEIEIPFNNATTWVPGRSKFKPMTLVYRDVTAADAMPLYNWISTLYNFNDGINLSQSEKAGWNGIAKLDLYDGCGKSLETWFLASCFPTSVDFGALSYDDSEIAEVELTLRYSEVYYQNNCGPQISACCRGC